MTDRSNLKNFYQLRDESPFVGYHDMDKRVFDETYFRSMDELIVATLGPVFVSDDRARASGLATVTLGPVFTSNVDL